MYNVKKLPAGAGSIVNVSNNLLYRDVMNVACFVSWNKNRLSVVSYPGRSLDTLSIMV
jgi:hypothetical protein